MLGRLEELVSLSRYSEPSISHGWGEGVRLLSYGSCIFACEGRHALSRQVEVVNEDTASLVQGDPCAAEVWFFGNFCFARRSPF